MIPGIVRNQGERGAIYSDHILLLLVDNYSIENTETKGAPAFSVKAIQTSSQVLDQAADGTVSVKNQKLTLIPYYAWNHRGANQMNVWFYQNLNVLDK